MPDLEALSPVFLSRFFPGPLLLSSTGAGFLNTPKGWVEALPWQAALEWEGLARAASAIPLHEL